MIKAFTSITFNMTKEKIVTYTGKKGWAGSPGKPFAYPVENKIMKRTSYLGLSLLTLAVTLSSCEAIKGIFKAGFWSAIILIVVVIGLILWLVGRGRR